MRLKEILEEDYTQNLKSDLDNLLVSAKAGGASEVNTLQLVQQLASMGYSVNTDSILSLMKDNPHVMNATPEAIVISATVGAEQGAEQDSAEHVKKMASKAASKVKKG